MAGIVDPFDAKIVDPTEIKPGSRAEWLNRMKQGSFTGAAMTGFASSVFGLPGDLEYLGRAGINALGGHVSPTTVLPTTPSLEKKLAPFPEEIAAHPFATKIGELLPGAVPAGAALAKGAQVAARALSTERAQQGLKAIAEPKVQSAVGDVLRKGLDARLTRLEEARAAATKPLYDEIAANEAKIASGTLTTSARNELERVTAALKIKASAAYAKASKQINEFQGSVGRAITGEATRDYAPGFQVDAARLPSVAFKSRDSVRALKNLAGGDAEWVEAQARLYAASRLDNLTANAAEGISAKFVPGKKAAQMADAASKWARDNQDWLREVPGTNKAVNAYVAQLRKVAHRQIGAAVVGSGAALAFLMSEGDRPWYWMRHLLPVY